MEPESIAKIAEWNKVQQDKKLLIRSGAMKSYKEGTIKSFVSSEVNSVVEDIFSVGEMTKEEVGLLIGRLERGKLALAAIAQGLQIAFADEKEPEFAERHKERERIKRESKPKTLESSLGALGIDLGSLMKAMGKSQNTPPAKTNKYNCEKCNQEVWIAMKDMHTCG